jgi:hypothetical protein
VTKTPLTFYTLTEDIVRKRLNKILQGRPLETLSCQICQRPFRLNEKIVRRRRKLYHLSCFNNSIFDISDDILTLEEQYFVENGFYPNESISTTSIPSTIPSTITIQSSS